MYKYQCPECEAVMKRALKVDEGKKIKCPKCESIFKAIPVPDAGEASTKAKTSEKKLAAVAEEEEEEGGTYVVSEKEVVTVTDPKAKEVNFGTLRDKYPKSKRGPAMAKTVTPSNCIMFCGALSGIGSIVYICWGLWPFIFSETPPSGSAATQRILLVVSGVLWFAAAAFMCHGGAKLHSLESYNWALAGCILCILFGVAPFGIAAGAFGLVTMKDEEVVAGFEETAEKGIET